MKIHVRYHAMMREQRGISDETVETRARTALEFYEELKQKHAFSLSTKILRVAVNEAYADWSTVLKDQDRVVFIPPVSGG